MIHPLSAWGGLLALGCAIVAGPLQAQLRPVLGASFGLSGVPAALQDPCGAPNTHATLEARAGLERGAFALETHAMLQGTLSTVMCVYDPLMREDGVHAERVYPFSRGAVSAADLRLRYRPFPTVPVSFHGGAGWLPSHDLPYVVAGAGLRGGGPVRLVLDVERAAYRIRFDQVWREWRDHAPVREVRREEHQQWEGGWSMRAGVEVPLRR